jgi:hypothetical protein
MHLRFFFFLLILIGIHQVGHTQTPDKDLTIPDRTAVINGKKYILHSVVKKETSYAISKKYNITIEALMAANPGMAANGLKADQVIQIPSSDKDKPTAEVVPVIPGSVPLQPVLTYSKPKKNKDSLSTKSLKDTLSKSSTISLTKPDSNSINVEYGIAMLLPLHLSTELSHHNEKEENTAAETLSASSLMGLEFYEGFKMAADSLQKEGLKARIFIYDTAGDTNKVSQLLLKPELKKAALIIGPMAPVSAISKVAQYAKENAIAMVSPLSNKNSALAENPFVIQITPSVKMQCRQMSSFIVDSFPDANIVLLNANSQKDLDLGTTFKQTIAALLKEQNNSKAKLTAINHADLSLKGVMDVLSATSRNIIIIPSSEEGFISVILSGLKGALEKYKITVVGLPTWQKFETIDATVFQQLDTHIFNSFYIDEQSEALVKFRKKFRAIYKTEPSEYVYHGFDAGYYYLKALMTFGPSFLTLLPELKFNLVHTMADFERKSPDGGYENKYISILKFDDFKLKKVNH